MDAHERVDAGDLQHAGHTRLRRRYEVERASHVSHAPCRLRENANTRGVQEGALGEVDDEVLGPVMASQGLLEDGHGGEVELAHDVNGCQPTGRLLDTYVKIAGRGHDGRV